MRYAFLGALLMVGGIAARILAARHHPRTVFVPSGGYNPNDCGPIPTLYCLAGTHVAVGLSQTSYDLVRIGGWALLIPGAVTIAFALLRELKRPAPGCPRVIGNGACDGAGSD